MSGYLRRLAVRAGAVEAGPTGRPDAATTAGPAVAVPPSNLGAPDGKPVEPTGPFEEVAMALPPPVLPDPPRPPHAQAPGVNALPEPGRPLGPGWPSRAGLAPTEPLAPPQAPFGWDLHAAGEQAGVRRMVVVSILGCDRFTAGYVAANLAHEQAMLAGAIPVRVLRAAMFHEMVAQWVEWGRQGEVCYVRKMRAQLVAARTAAEALADLALHPAWVAAPGSAGPRISEVAGPREEDVVEMARLLVVRRGDPVRIEGVTDPSDPDRDLLEAGAQPHPDATLAGPTFQEWLSTSLPDVPRRPTAADEQ